MHLCVRRQRQSDHCEFEASLIYIVSEKPGLHSEILSQKGGMGQLILNWHSVDPDDSVVLC